MAQQQIKQEIKFFEKKNIFIPNWRNNLNCEKKLNVRNCKEIDDEKGAAKRKTSGKSG